MGNVYNCVQVKLSIRDTLLSNITRAQLNYALAAKCEEVIAYASMEIAYLLTTERRVRACGGGRGGRALHHYSCTIVCHAA